MAFLHPLLGTLTVLFSIWILSRGLAARQGGKHAHKARRLHARWAWWALWGMVASLVSGLVSTVALRPELTLDDTVWHTALGFAVVGLMAVAAVLTRYFTKDPRLRAVHPWIGIAAVIGGIAQAIVGIELLP